jgi:GntR family transcriptional regulator
MVGEARLSNPDSPYHPVIPLHYQIQGVLRAQIESGKWPIGQRVPPEYDLMRRFEVSRTTIRRALRWLEGDGLIVRQRRKGTFVTKSSAAGPSAQGIRSLLLGYRADVRLLGVETIVAPGDIARLLDIGKDEKVREYRRLEVIDEQPLAAVFNYVRLDVADRIKDSDLLRFSMLEILRDHLKLKLGPLRQSIWADLPDENIAGLLRSDVAQPVLAVRLVVHAATGEPIQVCHAFYRGKNYRYETETFLPEGESAGREGIVDPDPNRPAAP